MTTAQNVTWPHNKDVVIQINPAKRKQIVRGLAVFGVVMLIVMIAGQDGGPLMNWAKQQSQLEERDKLEPTMRKLAAEGKPDAVIWVAKNYPGAKSRELEILIAQGNSEAMMVMAGRRWKAKDIDGAKRLIEQAATLGNLQAINYQLRNKTDK